MGKSRLVGKFEKEKKHQKSGKNDICVLGNWHVEEKACSPSSLRHIVRAWIFLLLIITIIVRCQVVVVIIITIITLLGKKIDLGARKNVVGWPSILDILLIVIYFCEPMRVNMYGNLGFCTLVTA
jgi:energy-coupling factor transporter transmembrane protein EcfT